MGHAVEISIGRCGVESCAAGTYDFPALSPTMLLG